MAIPKFDETMLPILQYVKDWKEYKISDVRDYLIDNYYQLSEEEKQEKIKSWTSRVVWNINWWKTYLKQAGLLEYPKRWFIKITKEGIRVLWTNPVKIDINTLKQYEQFNTFLEPNNSKHNIFENNNDIFQTQNPLELIESWFEKIESSLKQDLLEKLKQVNPYQFEYIVLELLKRMWYWDIIETSKSWDGWIDGIINEDELGLWKIYLQCKRYTTNNVREPEMRNFIWAMSSDVNKWVFVTTSDFDIKAKEKARFANHIIVLINGWKLVELMIKFNVWVQEKDKYIIKEIDFDFFEE